MVAGHVVGSTSSQGLAVDEDSAWRYGYRILEDLRMPLFSVLSGFVYAYRPITQSARYVSFVKGKARRLLVPLITVGAAFTIVQTLTPAANSKGQLSDVWKVYVFGYGHFWFLQSIFLVFLVVGLLNSLKLLSTIRTWIVALSASSALYILVIIPNDLDFFSVSGALRLLPFFILGYGLHVFTTRIQLVPILIGLFVPLFIFRLLTIYEIFEIDVAPERALRLAVGLCITSILVLCRRRLAFVPLARIGYFAFGIYLLHVFGSASTRIAMSKIGFENDGVIFVACLVVALALPVAFEVTLGRISWVSWTFLGQKPYRSMRKLAGTQP